MANSDGQVPPDCFNQQQNQQILFECSVCAENFGQDFNHQPRSLKCGHTFCTKCLMKIMTSRSIKCPMCNSLHQLSSPDVVLLPVNYAVQELIKDFSAEEEVINSEKPELPPCEVCRLPATIICMDCMPGQHFHFCEKCDDEEHGRPFGPVQRHRRFPQDKAPGVGTLATCSLHPSVTVAFFSEGLNEFACNSCVVEEDWPLKSSQFEPIDQATKKLQGKVQKLSKYTQDILKRLAVSKQQLEEILTNLEPSSINVKAEINTRFSALIEALQERQKILLSNVDIELKNRRENVMAQLELVVRSTAKYRDTFESLNSLISKTDMELLRLYASATQNIEPLLDSEDKSLLRPVINQTIPFYINKDTEKEVEMLGAVGGGLTPTDLECSSSGSQGSLMELLWQLPENCGKLSRFQIEYDQLCIERRDSGFLGGNDSDSLVYTQSESQLYEVAGNKLNAFLDYLCPGYSYQFRIRSANDAGWGIWSSPIMGKCEGFPFTLNYTKNIHRVVVPSSSYYRITVKGARAEDGMIRHGGKGAIISGIFYLKAGDVLILLCGGMSSRHHYHSGGGGGSFVAVNEISLGNLLIAAGGGGGTRGASLEDWDGSDASLTPDGKDGLGEDAGKGGVNGGPGTDSKDKAQEGLSFGNGGAGFSQNSSTAMSFLSGGHGGQNGGFGGGGAVGMYGGGGGGGFSGGGGGRGGGGGGSYISSVALGMVKEVGNDGHGSIVIDKVMPPYPIPEQKSTQQVVEENKLVEWSSDISTGSLGVPLFSQCSGGTSASLLTSLSSKAMSTGTSVGTIPESSLESPANTGQVMDHSKPSAVVSFSVGQSEFIGSGDNSGDHGDVRADASEPFEVDPSGPRNNFRAAPDITPFVPVLEEYLGPAQPGVTEAAGNFVATTSSSSLAEIKVTEVAVLGPSSYTLSCTNESSAPSEVPVKNLIDFQTDNSDLITRSKVSPEDVANIVQYLSNAEQVPPSHSQVSVSVADNSSGSGNPEPLRTSKSLLMSTTESNLNSQQPAYQLQHLDSVPSIPTSSVPSHSPSVGASNVAPVSSDPALTLQWLLQHQQIDARELQQTLAEVQRYLLVQQQQQLLHQHLHPSLSTSGKEDLPPSNLASQIPPLIHEQQQPSMAVTVPQTDPSMHYQYQLGTFQPPIQTTPAAQLLPVVQPQQQTTSKVQATGVMAPPVGTRDQVNPSPPLVVRQQNQAVAASQQEPQPSGKDVDSDTLQYRQQAQFDSSPNWNSNSNH